MHEAFTPEEQDVYDPSYWDNHQPDDDCPIISGTQPLMTIFEEIHAGSVTKGHLYSYLRKSPTPPLAIFSHPGMLDLTKFPIGSIFLRQYETLLKRGVAAPSIYLCTMQWDVSCKYQTAGGEEAIALVEYYFTDNKKDVLQCPSLIAPFISIGTVTHQRVHRNDCYIEDMTRTRAVVFCKEGTGR